MPEDLKEFLQSVKKLEREKEEQQKLDKNLEQSQTEKSNNEK